MKCAYDAKRECNAGCAAYSPASSVKLTHCARGNFYITGKREKKGIRG